MEQHETKQHETKDQELEQEGRAMLLRHIERAGMTHAESGTLIKAGTDEALRVEALRAEAISGVEELAVLLSFEEAQVEGEADLIVELIDLYLEDAPRQVAMMEAGIAEGDGSRIKRGAHSLKGSSGNLGAGEVAALCEELERLDSEEWSELASGLMARLKQELARVGQVFAAERQRRT